jgi:hypothetical protein
MKQLYPNVIALPAVKPNLQKAFLTLIFSVFTWMLVSAHKTPELIWRRPTLESGTAGANGAVYRFSQVDNNVDALVKINGRSNALVQLVNLDLENNGWDKAWQPQVTYNNGNAPGAADWWMEFEVTFVNKTTSTATSVSEFDVTGLDIDGNGDRIREYISFYNMKSSLLEGGSLLSVSNILESILGLLNLTGKRFDGPTVNYQNIDTSGTAVMVTGHYENISKFRVRTGGVATAANGAADRMYSLYFKGFEYQAPVTSMLPATMINWGATYANSAVSLKWTTTMEKNTSHFIIERSFDGIDYSDAAMLVTAGNSDIQRSYSFNDKVAAGNSGTIYYRLLLVDLDGRTKTSDIRIVRIGKSAEVVKIVAYPNPVVSDVRITVPQNWQNKKIDYQLVNTNGQAIKSFSIQHASQTEVISMANVPAGMYIMKVSNGNEISTQAIVKSKD